MIDDILNKKCMICFDIIFGVKIQSTNESFIIELCEKNLDPRMKFSSSQNFLLYLISFFWWNLLRRKAFEKAFPKLHLRFSIACQLSSWIEGDEEEPFHFQKKMSRKDENIFLLVSILSIT